MRRVIDVGEDAARLDAGRPRNRVDANALEPPEVDNEAVVDRPEAGPVVAAAADGDR